MVDLAESEAPPARGDLILLADPSAEGEAIASALRARSFWVVDAPLAVLEARATSEPPRAIILDVEQAGSIEVIERVREALEGKTVELFCIGDAVKSAELGASRAARRCFDRPVDVAALVDAIAEIAEPTQRELRGTTPPPSYLPRPETSRPARRESEAPVSGFPGPDAELGGILPSLEEEVGALKVSGIELSPELARILDAAEQRVMTSGQTASADAEEEVDVVLSPELLQVLDEPLDAEDDEHRTGSELNNSSGTPMPRGRTGSATGTQAQTGTVATTGSFTAAPATSTNPGQRPITEIEDATSVPSRRDPTFEARTPAPFVPEMQSMDTLARGPASVPFGETPIESTRSLRGDAIHITRTSVDDALLDPRVRDETFEDERARVLREAADERARFGRVDPAATARFVGRIEAHETIGEERARMALPDPQPRPPEVTLPAVLREGDATLAVARSIAGRLSGALALGTDAATRRIVLHDGDVVTAGSGVPDESLVAFLTARGDLERDVGARLAGKLPPFGRHAGAALIANGHLKQDDLWPVLRAHAEWVIARAIASDEGACELEPEPPGRLRAEPNVFGGATGAEVFVEAVRRVFTHELAVRRLGGPNARVDEGARFSLVAECALRSYEEDAVRSARGKTVAELTNNADPDLAAILYALVSLGVLDALAPLSRAERERPSAFDPLDEEALRQRVRARHALVEEGDYFALLGIPRAATSYEIKRAYLELRRAFEPGRVLTASTADLADQIQLVLEVLDEAYAILKEPHRRERYRRAIESGPPN